MGSLNSIPEIWFFARQINRRANGGMESLCLLLEHAEAYRPVMFTNGISEFTQKLDALGIKHINFSFDRTWLGAAKLPRILNLAATNLAVLLRLLRGGRPRAILANDFRAFWSVCVAAKILGVRTLFFIRGTPGIEGFKWRLTRVLADVILALSHDMIERINSLMPAFRWFPFRQAELRLAGSIVDNSQRLPSTENKAALRRRLGLSENHFYAGMVAGVQPRKQQLELLMALRRNLSRLPQNLKFVFVGDCDPRRSEYEKDFMQTLKSSDLTERTLFVNYQTNPTDYYRAFDVVLITSKHEGLARCMLESLACGVPVLSFDVCSAREVLDNYHCGIVTEINRFDLFIEELITLAEEPKGLEEMGTRGYAAVAKICNRNEVVARFQQALLQE